MSNTAALTLPQGFEALAPFVDQWALASAAQRAEARLDASPQDRLRFFEAVKPIAAEALTRLDAKPLAEHNASERALMQLLLSFAHVSLAVEIQGEDEAAHAIGARAMRITRAPADL